MNRNFGISAGVIALVAFVLHIAVPGGMEGRSDSATPIASKQEKSGKHKGKTTNPDAAEAVQDGPWLATRAFFQTTTSPKPPKNFSFDDAEQISGCSKRPKCASVLRAYFGFGAVPRIQFLLATVPDPLHSRLSLFTDSSIEAIQKAATDLHWQFATQWLPWSDEVDPDETDPRVRSEERELIRMREKQPGVLVFRPELGRSEPILVIFLIGETPTAGVNPTEFQIARAYMRAIHEPEDEIKIQGPTFSGSLYSLRKLLLEDSEDKKLKQAVVRSGTVSDWSQAQLFRSEFNFWSANWTDNFLNVVDLLGIPPEDAAVLAEDETDYGSAAVREPKLLRYRVFRFPRDISHLRNASPESLPTTRPNGAPANDLDFSLKDSDVAEDSIPTFAKTQTALSQNAVINEITGAIHRDRIRIVQIEATNVLDLLFLTRVLKQQCPDTRLLIPYADLLFVQAAKTNYFTGILALSPYPLFAESNEWTEQKNIQVTFPGSPAEGVYEATKVLLKGSRDAPRGVPQLWLLALDREGFEPVHFWRGGGPNFFPQPIEPTARWMFTEDVIALVSVALLAWILCLLRYNTILRYSAFSLETVKDQADKTTKVQADEVTEDRVTKNRADELRLFYLFLLALILGFLQALLCAPLWLNLAPGLKGVPPVAALILPALGVLCAWWSAVFALLNIKLLRIKIAGGVALAFVLLPAFLWVHCCLNGTDGQTSFFSFRAIEMRIGTSPLWPLITGLAVLFLFSLFSLRRLHLAVYETPEITVKGFSESLLKDQLEQFYGDFTNSVKSAVGFWKPAQKGWALLAGVAAIAIFSLAQIYQHLSSIDGSYYDIFFILVILGIITTLLLTCWQVMSLWHSLQGFLKCLQIMPLARAFIPPDASGNSRPLWVRRLSLQSVDMLSDALIVLQDMKRIDSFWTSYYNEYRGSVKDYASLDAPRGRLTVHKLRENMRGISRKIAVEAFRVAYDKWTSRPLVERRGTHTTEQDESQCRQRHAPLEIVGNPRSLSRLAETFVAVHCSIFLLYGVSQIRNLLFFLPSGFVLLVFSLNSYSHQSPRLIGRLLLALFVLVGAVIWTCIAGMERDPILSCISGTAPGKLTAESYLKIIAYGAAPVLGLLASEFPSISNFLYSWIAPSLQSAH